MTEKTTFETAFAQLEQIVNELESGEITLEESIQKFEYGVELYQYCKDELSKVEDKIKILMDKINPPEEEQVDQFLKEE